VTRIPPIRHFWPDKTGVHRYPPWSANKRCKSTLYYVQPSRKFRDLREGPRLEQHNMTGVC